MRRAIFPTLLLVGVLIGLAYAADPDVILGVPRGTDHTCASGEAGFYEDASGNLKACEGTTTIDLNELGAGSIGEAAVDESELGAHVKAVIFCGDGNGTVPTPVPTTSPLSTYLGHPARGASTEIGGTACVAQDAATAAGTDEVLMISSALKVLGMECSVTGIETDDAVTFTLLDDTAVTTPAIACTVDAGAAAGDCTVLTETTTDIAAASKLAVRATQTYGDEAGDATDDDYWCTVYFADR